MLKKKQKKIYQPCRYTDDGTDIRYGDIPEGLYSWQAFSSPDEARQWLRDNDYNPDEYAIIAYDPEDIEDYQIIF